MKIGFLGAGNVARRLGKLMADAGHEVYLSARAPQAGSPAELAVLDFATAAQLSEVVIVALPFDACAEILPLLADRLAGKIVIDATNPVAADWSPQAVAEGSAAQAIAASLPQARLVKAFNTIFADTMTPAGIDRPEGRIAVFVASDDGAARTAVATLAASLGFRPRPVGPLRHAAFLEGIAHLNIHVALHEQVGTDLAVVYSESSRDQEPQPTMSNWEEAWLRADPGSLGACYAEDAVLMHPRKPAVVGRAAIADFLGGGAGKIAVVFERRSLQRCGELAFEHGDFFDRDLKTHQLLATGTYGVSWVKIGAAWQIAFHGFNSPPSS